MHWQVLAESGRRTLGEEPAIFVGDLEVALLAAMASSVVLRPLFQIRELRVSQVNGDIF